MVLTATFCVLGIYEMVNRAEPTNVNLTDANPLINISELPAEFMETYLADYAEMATSDNKENILIVTSKAPLEDDFGAQRIVKAANNQYFLEYETAEAKDFAHQQMSSTPNLTVSENHLHELFDNNASDGGYNSWGIEKMGLNHASELVENASDKNDVIVAITDTGLDMELFLENYPAEKLAGEHSMVEPDGSIAVDDVGHGTHIAGTIAEGTPSNVKILPIQMTKVRSIYATDVIAAVDYVVYYTDADVINMSFGSPDYVEAEYLSIEAAKEKGIIPVAAAGNETISAPRYPSAFDNTISVSALDEDLNFASDFSNYGSMIDFGAPGAEIKSINATWSGTSMAAPHVVAAASIAKSLNKDLNMDATKNLLITRAIDLGPKGRDNKYGYGFIDFNDAKLCTAQSESCDEFGIFETEVEDGIEIGEAVLTPYNYGSLTNILATPIRIKNQSGGYTEQMLGDFGTGIEITGYDPYAAGAQEITVKYNGFETAFTMENPDDWESGWIYKTAKWEATDASETTRITKYKDHGLGIKTLYLPEEIDGKIIRGSSTCPFNNSLSDGGTSCDGETSADTEHYRVAVLPANYVYVNGFNAEWDNKVRFQNLYKIVSLADEIIVDSQAFSGLHNLQIVDAKVKFAEGAEAVFARDELLEKVTLSENNTVIPKNTFKNCGSLETVELPNSITEIGEGAFVSSGVKGIDLKNVQKLGKEAFAESNLEEIEIPATLTDIDLAASLPPSSRRVFSGTNSLRTLTVAQSNPVFDSRDDSNAIIETAEDKLVIGTRATVIPASVKTIGEGSFDSVNIDEITIPEGVKTIEAEAFANIGSLQKVVLPRSLETIDEEAFAGAGVNTMFGTVFWIWNDSAAAEWIFERDLPYVLMDDLEVGKEPALVESIALEAVPEDREFHALETLSPENYIIKVFYRDAETKKPLEEPEIITNYTVIYSDGEAESLKDGSNSITLIFDTATGYRNIKVSDILMVGTGEDPDENPPDADPETSDSDGDSSERINPDESTEPAVTPKDNEETRGAESAGAPATGFLSKTSATEDGATESLVATYFAAALVALTATAVTGRCRKPHC